MDFYSKYLVMRQKEVPLQRVFHSIRFKVNKRLVVVKQPFFMPTRYFVHIFHSAYIFNNTSSYSYHSSMNKRISANVILNYINKATN